MDLFTYLMAKNGNNTSVHGDLFSYLLGKGNFELGFFFPIIVSVIGLSVSYFFWKIGLKHYESAGS